jgi:glycosyltransferase involved in cell wall biosynthesis
MRISVIVPVRDEAQSISALLDGLLAQSRPPDEIVIADGGSIDETAAIIDEYISRGAPIQLIWAGPALPGRGRNIASGGASCECTGDVWAPRLDATEALRYVVAEFDQEWRDNSPSPGLRIAVSPGRLAVNIPPHDQ